MHIKKLRESRNLDVRMVMLSSADGGNSEELRNRFGLHGYLHKPIKQSGLLDLVFNAMFDDDGERTEDRIQASASPAEFHRTPGRPLRILVAEDNLVNQQLMLRILERDNPRHEVLLAENGRAACEIAGRRELDIILMDVQMPEMDGMEAAAEIRRTEDVTSHVPIVALTAHAIAGYRQKCLNAGMDAYVAKPVQVAELLHVVAEMVETQFDPTTMEVQVSEETDPKAKARILDHDELLDRVGSDIEFLDMMTVMFKEDCPRHLGGIQQCLLDSDFVGLGKVAHTLKGSTGNISAKVAHQRAIELQDAAGTKNREDCVLLIAALSQDLQDVFVALDEMIMELHAIESDTAC